jgi:hypothetical protein
MFYVHYTIINSVIISSINGPSGKISPLIVIDNDITHPEWPMTDPNISMALKDHASPRLALRVPEGPREPQTS